MGRKIVHKSTIGVVASLALAGALQCTPLGAAASAAPSHHAKGTVHVAKLSVGSALVDKAGRTLYVFSPDAHKAPTCTGTCASYWPPLLVRHKPVPGTGVRKSLLGTVRTANGKLQVTYHHWPLYTFAEDTARGQASGQGLEQFGGKWSTIARSGRSPFATSSTAPSTTTSSGGYGGY